MNKLHDIRKNFFKCILVSGVLGAKSCLLALPDSIYGSISSSFGWSDEHNYLGDTKQSISHVSTEFTIGTQHTFGDRIRYGVQFYAHETAGYSEQSLDLAFLDWRWSQGFSIQAGRLRKPGGLFSETRDIDETYSFAMLPNSVYSRYNRDFEISIDGIGIYGNQFFDSLGTVSYKIFGGTKPKLSAPHIHLEANSNRRFFINDSIEFNDVFGLNIGFFPERLKGLQLNFTYTKYQDTISEGYLGSTNDFANIPLNASEMMIPALIDLQYGRGTWDFSGSFAGSPFAAQSDTEVIISTLQYSTRKLNFIAEYQHSHSVTSYQSSIGDAAGIVTNAVGYYGMVTYALKENIDIGTYYSEFYPVENDRKGHRFEDTPVGRGQAYSRDWAIVLRIDPTQNLTFKIEHHLFNGTFDLWNREFQNGPLAEWSKQWQFVVLKATVRF